MVESRHYELPPQFEENKRRHEEIKSELNPIVKRSSTGECTSEAGSNESCNFNEEEQNSDNHNNIVQFNFLDGDASNEKLKNEKGRILQQFTVPERSSFEDEEEEVKSEERKIESRSSLGADEQDAKSEERKGESYGENKCEEAQEIQSKDDSNAEESKSSYSNKAEEGAHVKRQRMKRANKLMFKSQNKSDSKLQKPAPCLSNSNLKSNNHSDPNQNHIVWANGDCRKLSDKVYPIPRLHYPLLDQESCQNSISFAMPSQFHDSLNNMDRSRISSQLNSDASSILISGSLSSSYYNQSDKFSNPLESLQSKSLAGKVPSDSRIPSDSRHLSQRSSRQTVQSRSGSIVSSSAASFLKIQAPSQSGESICMSVVRRTSSSSKISKMQQEFGQQSVSNYRDENNDLDSNPRAPQQQNQYSQYIPVAIPNPYFMGVPHPQFGFQGYPPFHQNFMNPYYIHYIPVPQQEQSQNQQKGQHKAARQIQVNITPFSKSCEDKTESNERMLVRIKIKKRSRSQSIPKSSRNFEEGKISRGGNRKETAARRQQSMRIITRFDSFNRYNGKRNEPLDQNQEGTIQESKEIRGGSLSAVSERPSNAEQSEAHVSHHSSANLSEYQKTNGSHIGSDNENPVNPQVYKDLKKIKERQQVRNNSVILTPNDIALSQKIETGPEMGQTYKKFVRSLSTPNEENVKENIMLSNSQYQQSSQRKNSDVGLGQQTNKNTIFPALMNKLFHQGAGPQPQVNPQSLMLNQNPVQQAQVSQAQQAQAIPRQQQSQNFQQMPMQVPPFPGMVPWEQYQYQHQQMLAKQNLGKQQQSSQNVQMLPNMPPMPFGGQQPPYMFGPQFLQPPGPHPGQSQQQPDQAQINQLLPPKRRSSNDEVKQALMSVVQEFSVKGDARNADKVMNFINQMK